MQELSRRAVGSRDDYDDVIVGSGINSLVAGALLSRAGRKVCVLEVNDYFGGAIKTAEITKPGFVHDVFSAWHPLFVLSPAYARLRDDLEAGGLSYRSTPAVTATVFPDGSAAVLSTSLDENVAEFEHHAAGDGEAWRRACAEFQASSGLSYGLLSTELASPAGAALLLRALRQLGPSGVAGFAGNLLTTSRAWLEAAFSSPRVRGLLAPWVLHTGLGPDAASSGFMNRAIADVLQSVGLPVPQGGGARLVDALVQVISERGGHCRSRAEADTVLVNRGRATGVRLSGGEIVNARQAVLCSVSPQQLYGHLLRDIVLPQEVVAESQRFRVGRAGMQIHYALVAAPLWQADERIAGTPVVHLTPGLDGVSRAVNEADRGLLPDTATIVCGQPCVADPSRAPDGGSMLWIQLQDLPARPVGDAAGTIDVGTGEWTQSLRERYADRIQDRIGRHIAGFESSILARVVLSPADIAAANRNLVGGDIYGGACDLDQSFLWRPRPGLRGHRTPIRGLFHIGASTHPGPGLGAGSGQIVADQLLAHSAATRHLGDAGRKAVLSWRHLRAR
ncbi:MAG: phytoene desaturase family protein [Acidimicrobiales bacterium]